MAEGLARAERARRRTTGEDDESPQSCISEPRERKLTIMKMNIDIGRSAEGACEKVEDVCVVGERHTVRTRRRGRGRECRG